MSRTPARAPGLSIFFPAYNDSGTIASLVIAARQTAARFEAAYDRALAFNSLTR
jgi:hypothetical protein